MPRRKPHVIVMGGSLGGLTAALFLRDAGCEVTVFERARAPLAGQGAGIVLSPFTVRYFAERGSAGAIEDLSVRTRYVRYIDGAGHVVSREPVPYRFSSYNAIYHGLRDSFGDAAYHLGEEVVDFIQDETSVTVRTASGRSAVGDLLICADGIRSSARATLLPASSLSYAGYIAWRGILSAAEVPPDLYTANRDDITYHILDAGVDLNGRPAGGHVLVYPIPVVDRPGGEEPYINWLWYRNVPDGPPLREVLTDRAGRTRSVSLSPGTVRDDAIADLNAAARARLPAPLQRLIAATRQPFIQAVMDCAIPHMAFGRICLIGDGAFVARPHAAAGTAKAAEDGYQLSKALLETALDVPRALALWEPRQLALGRSLVRRNQEAGALLQSGAWPVGAPLSFGLYETGDSIMT